MFPITSFLLLVFLQDDLVDNFVLATGIVSPSIWVASLLSVKPFFQGNQCIFWLQNFKAQIPLAQGPVLPVNSLLRTRGTIITQQSECFDPRVYTIVSG